MPLVKHRPCMLIKLPWLDFPFHENYPRIDYSPSRTHAPPQTLPILLTHPNAEKTELGEILKQLKSWFCLMESENKIPVQFFFLEITYSIVLSYNIYSFAPYSNLQYVSSFYNGERIYIWMECSCKYSGCSGCWFSMRWRRHWVSVKASISRYTRHS